MRVLAALGWLRFTTATLAEQPSVPFGYQTMEAQVGLCEHTSAAAVAVGSVHVPVTRLPRQSKSSPTISWPGRSP